MCFYGEEDCSATVAGTGKPCTNKATMTPQLCKMHARKVKGSTELSRNPNKKANDESKIAENERLVLQMQAQTKNLNKKGNVIATKMRMRRAVPDVPGFRKVFPNNRHGGRADGFGCPSLSPMRMGPVYHGQPGLPPAKNLENLHQSNKVFPSQTYMFNREQPLPHWFETRVALYNDPEPHRHVEAALGLQGQAKNVPLYSVWRNSDGVDEHYTYLQSRQFYCHFYEQFATESHEFLQLKQWIKDGVSLQIVGYDAREVDRPLIEMYRDTSAPFGHELVLYTLLTVDDANEYPWNIDASFDFETGKRE